MSQTESALSYNEDDTTYCAVHTERETSLRCNKCDRYMCAECAVQTPIGYRCRQCVRQVEDRFFTGTTNDYLIAFAVCTFLSAIGAALVTAVNFFLLAIFITIPIAGAIAEASFRATGRRRGRYSGEIAAGGAFVGAVLGSALRAYFQYPDEFAEAVRVWELRGNEAPFEFTRLGYVSENFLTLTLIIYIGVSVFVIYNRVKS